MAEQVKRREGIPKTLPNQLETWDSKIADDHKWFKQNADYLISRSRFMSPTNTQQTTAGTTPSAIKMSDQLLFDVYNSRFPSNWFASTLNPLNSKKKEFQNWPAKIRPVNILRTNIDFLAGEFTRRPFQFSVVNFGEDGYNRFTEGLQKQLNENLTQHFTQMVSDMAKSAGVPMGEVPGQEEIELPWSIKEKFAASYKDNLAAFGERQVRRVIAEYKCKRLYNKIFKDYLIAGKCYTYKNMQNDQLIYEAIGPMDIAYEKSISDDFVEDASWVTARRWMTPATIVERFWGKLSQQELEYVEKRNLMNSPGSFHLWLNSLVRADYGGLIPVYHVQWKGRKRIKFLTSVDEYGKLIEEQHDENYPTPEGVSERFEWVNEVYEIWRIADHIYVEPRIVPMQRNVLTNISACKLSYNGVMFSDRFSANVSPMELGLPYQLLYMITGFILEKTTAKSKGKIVFIDKNVIPRDPGWTEEKFMYYSEALGWAMTNRNQAGVDKSISTYQVLDLGLFDHIKELINLQGYFKSEWDELLGITRQRKGQMMASDDVGNSQAAILQSSIITDTLFINFEDFLETELQGLLDYSRIAAVASDDYSLWNTGDYTKEMLSIDLEQYAAASLGLVYQRSAEEMRRLQTMQSMASQIAQNSNVRLSMLSELVDARSMSELKIKIGKLEQIQDEMAAAQGEAEARREEKADKRMANLEQLKADLEVYINEREYDRKERLELIKGDINLHSFNQDGDQNDNGIPDINEIYKRYVERDNAARQTQTEYSKMASAERMQAKELAQREKESQRKAEVDKKKIAASLKNKVVGEK